MGYESMTDKCCTIPVGIYIAMLPHLTKLRKSVLPKLLFLHYLTSHIIANKVWADIEVFTGKTLMCFSLQNVHVNELFLMDFGAKIKLTVLTMCWSIQIPIWKNARFHIFTRLHWGLFLRNQHISLISWKHDNVNKVNKELPFWSYMYSWIMLYVNSQLLSD